MDSSIEQLTKKCPRCGNDYPLSIDFFRKRKANKKHRIKEGYNTYCLCCEKIIKKEQKIKYWENNLVLYIDKNRLKKKDFTISKTITKEDIKRIYEEQKGLCYWLKIPLDVTFEDKLRRPSIDRLDNDRGYDPDNIVLTTQFANLGRQSSSEKDFLNFINNFINK